jgi:hypothetical protein
MTNRQRRTVLRPEHTESLKITAQLPGATRELPLANGTTADLAGILFIAEIEPIRRWQTGLCQVLEYWDQALRSPRPILILIEDGTHQRPAEQARIIRLCASNAVTLWRWDPELSRFTQGGPRSIPTAPDYSPLMNWNAAPWTPPADALKSCSVQREPYRTWKLIYTQRDASRPSLNHQKRIEAHGQGFRSA